MEPQAGDHGASENHIAQVQYSEASDSEESNSDESHTQELGALQVKTAVPNAIVDCHGKSRFRSGHDALGSPTKTI